MTQASDLKVSFVGAYDNVKDKYYSFWEGDVGKLEEMMVAESEGVVGYNSWGFDYGVLEPYFKVDPRSFPSYDLMIAMKTAVGFRPKLDSLARANLGSGKIGTGLDAGRYWKEGKLEELEKYCLEDVRLTYEVWKIGEETGKIKYYSSQGFIRETEINWKDGFMQKVPEGQQGSFF